MNTTLNFEVRQVPVGMLDRHPWNREIDREDGEFQELLESIREHEIETPLSLREKEDGRFEIIKGERRFTCALMLGKETVPAFVAVYGDVDAYLALLRDNLQRKQLSPMQEAQGYLRLLDLKDGDGEAFTPERISKRVGRDVHTVYRRLKLVHVPRDIAQALEDGRIPERVAYLIGRLPGEEMRKAAAKRVMHPQYAEPGVVLTVKETQRLIEEEFMVSLKGCQFDLEDATLLPDLGACSGCVHLARNNPVFQADLASAEKGRGGKSGLDPLTCTNPEHYQLKMAAHATRVVDEAKKLGREVVSPKDAKKLFPDDGRNLSHNSGMERLTDKLGYSELGHWDTDKAPTYARIVDEARKQGMEVPVKVVVHPRTHEIIELVDHKKVIEAARKVLPKLFKRGGSGKKSDEELKAAKEQKLREAVKHELARRGALALQAAVERKGMGLEALDLLFRGVLQDGGNDGQFFLGKVMGVEAVVTETHGYKRKDWEGPLMRKFGDGYKRKDWEGPLMRKFGEVATTVNAKLGWVVVALHARALKFGGVEVDLDFETDLEEDDDVGFEHFAHHFGLALVAMEKGVKGELAAKVKGGKVKSEKGAELTTVSKSAAAKRGQAVLEGEEESADAVKKSEASGQRSEKPKKAGKAARLKDKLREPGTTSKAKGGKGKK